MPQKFQLVRFPWPGWVVLVGLCALSSCAINEPPSKAAALAAARDWEGAISSYRAVVQADPTNVENRVALQRVTAEAIAALLKEAADTKDGSPRLAREAYARVLALDPRNERALLGFRAIENTERRAALYAEALQAYSAGREREARLKAKQLLDDTPDHPRARELMRLMDEKAGRNAGPPQLDASFRKPVTLEFREAPIRTVFDVISRTTGVNFVFDRDLRQDVKVTVLVRNVPMEDALDQIALAYGLSRRVLNGNTMLIYASLPQKIREYQDQIIHNFFLENADAKQIGNLFRTILRTRDLFIDERRNLIVLRDTPEVVAMAVKLVATHDQPEPEVMLDVEILEVKHSVLNELGIKFPDQVAFGIPGPTTLDAVRGAGGGTIRVTGLDQALLLNLKRQVGSTNLLANPRIRVRNKERAKIHIGDRLPVITSTISSIAALTTESISYLDVGIKLEVEAVVQANDVVIKASLEVSSLVNTIKTNNGSTAYQLGSRNAATTLTLRDGETQVLAGLLQRNERGNSSRLPGLGDIPILGWLFSSDTLDGDKTEVLLSITPRILRNIERPADDLLEFAAPPEGGRGAVAIVPLLPVTTVAPNAVRPLEAGVSPAGGSSGPTPNVPIFDSPPGIGGVLRQP